MLGVLHRDDGITAPSRHLGLVPVAERGDARHALDRLSAQIASRVDLTEVARIAGGAPDLDRAAWEPAEELARLMPEVKPVAAPPVVAIAGGRAFTFRYPETDELLCAAGCRPVVFDPMTADDLPAGTAGIYLGGGFPEVHAAGSVRQPGSARSAAPGPSPRVSRPSRSAPACSTCPETIDGAADGRVPSTPRPA